MTIPVELLFMFVFAHLLSAFLNHASHDLPSFLFFLYRNEGLESSFPLALSRQACLPVGRGEEIKKDNLLKIPSPLIGEGKGGGELLIHDHIGLGSQYTRKSLEFGDDEIAKDIDVRSLHQNDHIIRTGRSIGSLHSLYLGGFLCDIPGGPCRALNKDVS